MRQLKTKDIFRLASLIKSLNVQDELAQMYQSVETEGQEKELGLQLFTILFDCMEKGEEDIIAFFADIAEVTPDEFQEMDFEELAKFIDHVKSMKGLGAFFQSVSKTLKAN